MQKEEILDLLGKMGAVTDSSSFDSVALMQDPIVTNRLAVELLQQIDPDSKPELVLSPEGIASYFGYSCALAAWTRYSCVMLDEGGAHLPTEVEIKKKERVLIVFDELNAQQASKIAALVKEAGAKLVAVMAIKNSLDDAAAEFEILKECEIITLL